MATWFSITKCHSRAIVLAMVAIAFSLINPAVASSETLQVYRTGVDVGSESGSGCDFGLGSVPPGALPGFELQVTVVVDTDLVPPQVISADVEICNGLAFANPQPLPGFSLQLNSGLLASDSVEGAIPYSFLGDARTLRLAHHAQSADGSEDALFTTDGSPGGAPIQVGIAAPIPTLSSLGLGLLALLLLGAALVQLRRGPWAAILALLLIGGGSVIAYAAFDVPSGVDDPEDAIPADRRAEIVASFAWPTTNIDVQLRLDIANIDISGWRLKSVAADDYVTAEIGSGILSATSPDPDSDFGLFALEYIPDESAFAWRCEANGRYFTVHEPDKNVFADAMDISSATEWVVYVLSAKQYAYTIIVLQDTPGDFYALQFDSSTENIKVVNYGSDLSGLLGNPAAQFILYID